MIKVLCDTCKKELDNEFPCHTMRYYVDRNNYIELKVNASSWERQMHFCAPCTRKVVVGLAEQIKTEGARTDD